MERTEANRLLLRARGLAAFRGVLGSEAGQDFLSLLGLLAAVSPDPALVVDVSARLWIELADAPEPLLEDTWRSHLVGRILESEHPFALAAERGNISTALMEQGGRNLRTLRILFDLDLETLLRAAEAVVPEASGLWATPSRPVSANAALPHREMADRLAATGEWSDLVG